MIKTVGEGPTAVVIKRNANYRINKAGILAGHKTDKVTGKEIVEALDRSTFTDVRDNQTYHTVKIGEQVWMVENLNVDRFSSNQIIKEANTERDWEKATKRQEPAWCYYNGD